MTAHSDPLGRVWLLPAYVQIMLEVPDLEAARAGCAQLDDIARQYATEATAAMAAQARGAVALADGDAARGLVEARVAWRGWLDLDAPFDAARARLLVAEACHRLGDEDSAQLEQDAAAAVLAGLEGDAASDRNAAPGGLSQGLV